jgi:hypothetical protein
MRVGLVIYGSLDTLTGGYLYDRALVNYLKALGDEVEVISLPWRTNFLLASGGDCKMARSIFSSRTSLIIHRFFCSTDS